MRFASLALSVVLFALGACAPPPPTALIVRVRTNLTVGTELVRIQISALRDRAPAPFVDEPFDLTGGTTTLPATVAIVPREVDDSRSITITVGGTLVNGGVTSQSARVPLSYTHVSLLDMFLSRECAGISCPAGQTCTTGAQCVNADRTSLPDVSADCGGFHETCCATGTECTGSLHCVNNRCQTCLDPDEECCEGEQFLANGTECGGASDECHAASVCHDGVCEAPAPVGDGTPCNVDASDPCQATSTCRAGVCVPAADGTVCGLQPDNCHRAPVCMGGVCRAPAAVADGTTCASATSPCQQSGTCNAGVCSGTTLAPTGTACMAPANPCKSMGMCDAGGNCVQANRPDGTMCATSTNPCVVRICMSGTCGMRNAVDNSVCGAAQDVCHLPRRCSSGVCQPSARQPDGHQYGTDANHRCCAGRLTNMTTATDCGVCGNQCLNGNACVLASNGIHYCACRGVGYNSDCGTGCCSTSYGNYCAFWNCRDPGATCVGCPTNATCNAGTNPFSCNYRAGL